MESKHTNIELLERTFNKVANNLNSVIDNTVSEHLSNNQNNNNLLNLDNNIQVQDSSKFYNIFGFEFSFYSLILIVLVICTIIYFIYKYFCKCDQDIVNIKKNILTKEDNKNKENKEDNKNKENKEDIKNKGNFRNNRNKENKEDKNKENDSESEDLSSSNYSSDSN
jgi:hypothetical protein